MKKGRIIVISAPSGAGKSTVASLVRQKLPELGYSVSLTTRKPRSREVDGKHYFFVTRKEFERRMENGEMAEYAEIYGTLYGTSAEVLAKALAGGETILLEIDFLGAAQLRKRFKDGVFIFLAPPSLKELERRLRSRGTEDEATVQKRMARAREEMDHAKEYDFVVINDDLEQAVDRVVGIIRDARDGAASGEAS